MLDQRDEAPNPGSRLSAPDAERWQAMEMHLRAAAESAERWISLARVDGADAARLAGMLHDIGMARMAFQDFLRHRGAADRPASASRRFGAFAGKFAVDDGFFDPLSEAELAAWSGR